jgi:hypothetical protein
MKIEVKGVSQPGYKAAIFENGEMVKGITEALISIKPDRMPILITEQVKFDANGKPFVNEDQTDIAKEFVIYYPGEFSMEA